jgi:serine/threonine-protein kinase
MNCPRCQSELSRDAVSCSSCGFSFDEATQRLEHPSSGSHKAAGPSAKPTDKRSFSSLDSIDDARYVPGTILAERYRIVGLLGRGGMGEVYRADDLKLAHPVALKFLPDHLATDSAALARFHREVRVARQVSHKNVCRVYDIGEIDGRHFLSMEFIKGEELSSLLRRIGRLPQDKALQLARQICAGLAAAHDIGFLHRDLKPANIMIDADGNARILDFGLGGLAGEFAEEEIRAGTPAYMSPEQIDGHEQTVQSDIYSLGLVLYELFTGKRAFEAASLNELIKLRRSDVTPTTPTSLVKDLDPSIEKVIDRCLQKSPSDRPASALQVAAALPGGDPLAAALAAGETPSPEMVAEAPTEGALKPAVAIGLFAGFLLLLAVSCWVTRYAHLYRLAPLNQPPEVLRARAHEVIAHLGYNDPVLDSADGFTIKTDYLDYVEAHDGSPNRWNRLRTDKPGPYRFWYRDSSRYFETGDGEITPDLPALTVSGMTTLYLDMDGRLRWFLHVPPQREQPDKLVEQNPVDWSLLFREAGYDLTTFQKVPSTWVPLHAYDERAAWDGVDPLRPDQKVHIEAATFHGKPIYFDTVYPWDPAGRQNQQPQSTTERTFIALVITVFMIALIGSALIARHNLRLGRGDISGALRVASVYLIVRLLFLLFERNHNGTLQSEFLVWLLYISIATFAGFYLWLLYIAIEPFLRRRWPHRIISWSRLLRGDFRDPLVGRDILIGACGGGLTMIAFTIGPAIASWTGKPFGLITTPGTELVGSHFFQRLASQVTSAFFLSLIMSFLFLLLVVVLRRERLALGAVAVVVALFGTLVAGGTISTLISGVVSALILILLLYRYGLLSLCAAVFIAHLWVFYPITTELRAWYATDFLIGAALCVALAAYACYISMAGQPIFGGKLLED